LSNSPPFTEKMKGQQGLLLAILRTRARILKERPTIKEEAFCYLGGLVRNMTMRLTLRTLLAYLDDNLDSSQTRIIGEKVAESEAAKELVARIKQVTRRRRLTTPSDSGPNGKLDENAVAEYLDNVLPPDQVAGLEETCLASDVHLAEVAACHQILALVLGEPILVPPTAFQRMYKLVKGKESVPDRFPPPIPEEPYRARPVNAPADESLLLGLPLSSERSALRWLVPILALCALLAGSAAIWMALPQSNPRNVLGEMEVAMGPPDGKVSSPDASPMPVAAAAAVKVTAAPDVKQSTGGSRNHKESGSAPGPKEERTAEKKLDKEEPIAPKPPIIPTPIHKAAEVSPIATTNWSDPAILLERGNVKEAWRRLGVKERVYPSRQLMSLPGYRSELRLDSGIQLSLWGNVPEFWDSPVMESVAIIHANPEFDLELTLDRGRILIANRKPQGAATARIHFLEQSWDLTLLEPNTEVAVELFAKKRPYTPGPNGTSPLLLLGVVALKGQAKLKADFDEHLLTSPSILEWDSIDGAADQPRSLPRPPDWWTARSATRTPKARAMESALYGLSQRFVVKDKIDVVLAETLRDIDPVNHTIAVRCLAALQDLVALIDALFDDKHSDIRADAIESLRYVVALDGNNDERLAAALKHKNFSGPQTQIALQLLHGYTDQQWQNRQTRVGVAEYLLHEKLPIREMAHHLLVSAMPEGKKISYDAAGDAKQRRHACEEWQKLVAGEPLR
jgi:hypothetical protein